MVSLAISKHHTYVQEHEKLSLTTTSSKKHTHVIFLILPDFKFGEHTLLGCNCEINEMRKIK